VKYLPFIIFPWQFGAREIKKKGKRAKFINKTRKSCFFLLFCTRATDAAAPREEYRSAPLHSEQRERKRENRFGEIFLLPMSSYYIMAVLLAPGGWIKRKEAASSPPRALFSHKKQFNLSCGGKHNTKDIAPPEINTQRQGCL